MLHLQKLHEIRCIYIYDDDDDDGCMMYDNDDDDDDV